MKKFTIAFIFIVFLCSGISVLAQEKVLSSDTPPRLVDPATLQLAEKTPTLVANNTGSRSLKINIIESQSINPGHDMDVYWQAVATAMGYTASIEPQSFLDDIANLASTDILIVSSGVIDIPQNRKDVIQQYVTQGGPTYIQSEYDVAYQANQTFMEIVNNLGGSFSWTATTSGDLIPMNIMGDISTIPNSVPSSSYFWYGCYGTGGSNIFNYMEYMGNYYGFIFTPPDPAYGVVVTNSDQDWAREGAERDPLMENHIQYLIDHSSTGISENLNSKALILGKNYPNPFTGNTVIPYSVRENTKVSLKVFDGQGNLVKVLVDGFKTAGDYTVEFKSDDLTAGFYFYILESGNIAHSRKMTIVK